MRWSRILALARLCGPELGHTRAVCVATHLVPPSPNLTPSGHLCIVGGASIAPIMCNYLPGIKWGCIHVY